MTHATGGWVVVVIEEHIAEGRAHAFVAVAVVVAQDLRLVAVGIDAGGEAADIDVAVVALLPGVVVVEIRTADAEGVPALVAEKGAAVPIAEIQAAIRPGIDAVQAVVVLRLLEAGEEDLPLVHGGIELQVTVHVRVLDDVRRVRDEDDIVENGHAQRALQLLLAHEDVAAVANAIAIRVLQNAHAVPLAAATAVTTVVDAFRDPDAACSVHVHVRRIEKLGGCGPHGDLQAFRHFEGARFEVVRRDLGGIEGGDAGIRREGRLARDEDLHRLFGRRRSLRSVRLCGHEGNGCDQSEGENEEVFALGHGSEGRRKR